MGFGVDGVSDPTPAEEALFEVLLARSPGSQRRWLMTHLELCCFPHISRQHARESVRRKNESERKNCAKHAMTRDKKRKCHFRQIYSQLTVTSEQPGQGQNNQTSISRVTTFPTFVQKTFCWNFSGSWKFDLQTLSYLSQKEKKPDEKNHNINLGVYYQMYSTAEWVSKWESE